MLLKMTYVDVRIILSNKKKYGIYDKDFFGELLLYINTPYFYCKNEIAKGKKRKDMQEMQTFSLKLIQVSFLLHMF